MATRSTIFAAALIAGLYHSVAASGALVTQNFNSDPPNWVREGTQNLVDPVGAGRFHNFGFKTSDNTGSTTNPPGGVATGAGEAGGIIASETNASYGTNDGGSLGMGDDMEVHGVIRFISDQQETMFGWFNSLEV